MSRENVEIVREGFAAFNRGGIDAALGYFDPNVELVAPIEWPEERVLWGHAGLRQIQAGWDEQFDGLQIELKQIIDLGENGVLVLYTNRIGVQGSDRELAQPGGLHIELRGGRVTRWRAYLSEAQALKAVGLEK